MKKTLIMMATVVAMGHCAAAGSLSLDDALYHGVGAEVKEEVETTSRGEVAYNDATFIFTVDADALVNAAVEYADKWLLLGVMEAGTDEEGYANMFQANFKNGYVYMHPCYYESTVGKTYTAGNNGVSLESLAEEDQVAFCIRGLTTEGGSGVQYTFTFTCGSTSYTNHRFYKASAGYTMDSFPGLIINDLQLNTDFVTSYYLFGEAVTASEARALTAEAFDALAAVPEPTTATLSIFALAGLMARRRRK